jgi:predicted site-specific integrase-resolvase
MQQEKTYSASEYARMRGVDRGTVYRWIRDEKVETVREKGKLCVLIQEEIPDEDVAEPVADASQIVALLRDQVREKDEHIKLLLEQVSTLQESIQQQNAIIMQMTRNAESTQKLLEYHETPFFRRLFTRRKSVE